MPKLLFTHSEGMSQHIKSFKQHYKIKSTSVAIRQLILDGFKYNNNPLNETATMALGFPAHKPKQPKPLPKEYPSDPLEKEAQIQAWLNKASSR